MKEVKKKPEGLERQTLVIVGTQPWLNAATNASAKQRLELLQCDGQPNNTISSRNAKENAER